MFKLHRERNILQMWPFYRRKIVSQTVLKYFLRFFSFNISIRERRVGFIILNTDKNVKLLRNNFVSRLVICSVTFISQDMHTYTYSVYMYKRTKFSL